MIDKRDVIAFFDRCAPDWDAGMVRNEAVIARILDNAGVCEGCTVLDVACGTGVLFPDYLARGAVVTGIDISPEMARIAAEKFAGEPRVQVLCGDVEETAFPETFDVVMVYNAFPHFPDPARPCCRVRHAALPPSSLLRTSCAPCWHRTAMWISVYPMNGCIRCREQNEHKRTAGKARRPFPCHYASSVSSRPRIRAISRSLSGISFSSPGSHRDARSSERYPSSNTSSPA